jgi:hypothetical protein
MTNMQPLRIALLAGCLLVGSIAAAQVARPTPPTPRAFDGPEAPPFTKIEGKGANAPSTRTATSSSARTINRRVRRTWSTTCPPAASSNSSWIRRTASSIRASRAMCSARWTPTIEDARRQDARGALSAHDHRLHPGAVQERRARAVHHQHDGPKLGDADKTLTRILDNLIDQKRIPIMIAILIQNGGGDAQGSQRGLEYDTMSGKFANSSRPRCCRRWRRTQT